jgi:hypothetical protein
MKTNRKHPSNPVDRRGSTLIIVIALLGLLAFTGMVFFTFASQERAAAEYFSEGAKTESEESDDPFPWALQQILVGPSNQPEQKGSILWSPTQRHSIVRNMIGQDIAPHTGKGLHVVLDAATGLPAVDDNYDGLQDTITDALSNNLNFVDAPSAWGGAIGRSVEGVLSGRRPFQEFDLDADGIADPREDLNRNGRLDLTGIPASDVDYSYPDLNHLFLGYKGWAIRDNGVEEDTNLNGILDGSETDTNSNGVLDRRFEQVRMFIPSFFRPQYLMSAAGKGVGGLNVPTDPDWYDETVDPVHQQYAVRSFRPHALHISGFDGSGNAVLRYLDRNNPAHVAAIAGLPGGSGHFPLRRGEGNPNFNNSANYGKLGVWTGDGAATSNTFELDSDNDGDGIREGIWLDLRYPLQETADGKKYTVMHSFTIYDLDGLIDLNAHGNLAGLPKNATINSSLVGNANLMANEFLSQSNLGIGPHEISPLFALAPTGWTADTNTAFTEWYTAVPFNRLEQANMEWAWILAGRIDGTVPADAKVIDGRWGDASALWYHRFAGGARRVNSLPRPGRAGNLSQPSSDTINSFGGAMGFDDNQDVLEGIVSTVTGRKRGVIHPLDVSGRGRRTVATDPRSPNLFRPVGTLPEQWGRYVDYPVIGNATVVSNNTVYIGGKDGDISTTADNLLTFTDATNQSNFNASFEDPYETIMDHDRAIRPDDQLFSISDLVSAHLTKTDEDNAKGVSDRLEKLAPLTFDDNSTRDEFFTTLSNSFRHFAISQDLMMRPWEWTADSDGDNFGEFPPRFGAVAEFGPDDPFRPQVRRLLFTESMEGRGVLGQLPLSLNQIIDVNRTAQTPLEGTAEFQSSMRRSGLRFRSITEHPLSSELNSAGVAALESVTTIPTVTAGSALPTFPPQTLEDREFWARRDRQQLARDIYTLLYTIGGAEWDTTLTKVLDYTASNSDRSRYSEDRLRLMAQFAVNVVDAMDSDNVITKFEFDKNLGDGWNLDDDAYTYSSTSDPASTATTTAINVTRDGMYPDDAADRGVVYGVEAQHIAFSEVLGIRSEQTANTVATPFNDLNNGLDPTYFLYIELQNMLPSPAILGSGLGAGETAANSIWRIVRKERTNKADPEQLPREAPAIPQPVLAFATDARNVISGGGRFTIAASTVAVGSVPSSDFYVDIGSYDAGTTTYTGAFDGTYELIAPNSPNGTFPTTTSLPTDPEWAPRSDLDLMVHTSAYFEDPDVVNIPNPALRLLAPKAAPGYVYGGHTGLLDSDPSTNPNVMQFETIANAFHGAGEGFDLVLERRLNPDLPSVSDVRENPWIEVDRVRVELKEFNIDAADDANALRSDADLVRVLRSTERAEALVDKRLPHAFVANGGQLVAFRSNSLKGDTTVSPDDTLGTNSGSSGGFNIWQPHFDREFASSGELLNIPVFPPNLLTQKLNFSRQPAWQQLGGATPNVLNYAGAAALFLWPDLTPELAVPDVAQAEDNRWYRLFQFVEVPSRVNRMVGNYVSLKRLPGKLNPNMIRDREIYAGLLDDTQFLNTNPLGDFNGNGDDDGPFANGVLGSTIDGQDGLDPFPPATNGSRDRWLEFVNERDGNVQSVKDPTPALVNSGDEINVNYWIPGTPNSRPFRSLDNRKTAGTDDNGLESTLLRRFAMDKPAGMASSRTNISGEGNAAYNVADDVESNRHWLEIGNRAYHKTNANAPAATVVEHHQQLSKVINNTTTVSNTFIIYGTAAYFEVSDDAAPGLIQVGGRMGLDLDGDSDPTNDAGWEQRAVFIVDRTELFNAYDPGSGSVDWKRLVKHRVNLSSDGK